MEKGTYYDDYANDQDWAPCYYMTVNEQSAGLYVVDIHFSSGEEPYLFVKDINQILTASNRANQSQTRHLLKAANRWEGWDCPRLRCR